MLGARGEVADADLTLEVVDRLDDFAALRDEWDTALTASANPNVFLSWDWLHTWWEHFGEGVPGRQLHVVVVREGDDLVAAAPLFREERRAGPVRVLRLRQISYDAGDYGGILLVRRTAEAVDSLLDHLGRQLRDGVSTVTLSRLQDDSTFLARLRQGLASVDAVTGYGLRASEHRLEGACPFADVRDGYNLARHLKKHKVRQRLRRISEKYDVEFTWHSGDGLEEGIQRLLHVHQQRWAGREDELQGQLADAQREAFLLDAMRAMDRRGRLRLLTLTADGHTVGAELDFELAGRVYMFKGAFDPQYAEFSPGQLLTYRVFEDGLARGVQEFDFLRGDHPYKRRWADRERHLVAVTLRPPGIGGWTATARARLLDMLQRAGRA